MVSLMNGRWGYLSTALAVCAFGVGACGDDDSSADGDPDAYQAEIIEVVTEAEAEIRASSLFTDLVTPGESAAECAELMDEFRTGLSTIADRIDSIEPPEEVTDPHDELAETFREGADELADDEAQIEAGELKCGRKLNNRIYGSPLREQGERAIEEIEAGGYVVLGR